MTPSSVSPVNEIQNGGDENVEREEKKSDLTIVVD